MTDSDIRAVQRYYPQIYFACHVDHVRKASTSHQLSSHDSGVLAHLDEKRPVTPKTLAQHLGVVPSTFSPLLERLVRLGYIARERSERDRRQSALRLSELGAKAMAATSVLDQRRVEQVLAQLTPNERKRAVDGMRLLAGAAVQVTGQRRKRT